MRTTRRSSAVAGEVQPVVNGLGDFPGLTGPRGGPMFLHNNLESCEGVVGKRRLQGLSVRAVRGLATIAVFISLHNRVFAAAPEE
jgi:hypothetical protein